MGREGGEERQLSAGYTSITRLSSTLFGSSWDASWNLTLLTLFAHV